MDCVIGLPGEEGTVDRYNLLGLVDLSSHRRAAVVGEFSSSNCLEPPLRCQAPVEARPVRTEPVLTKVAGLSRHVTNDRFRRQQGLPT